MDGIKCHCGIRATEGIVRKEGPSKGKHFLRCPRFPNPDKCNFFEWVPSVALPSAPVAAPTPPPTPEKDMNIRVTKLEWRCAILEDAIRKIGKGCEIQAAFPDKK